MKTVTGTLWYCLGLLWAQGQAATLNDSPTVLAQVHSNLLSKFTSKQYRHGQQKLINHIGDVPFSGDCVDYYVAAHHQLDLAGYRPYARLLSRRKDREGHIVACVDLATTLCLDPNARTPRSLRSIHKEYRTEEVRRVPDSPE